MSVIMNSVLTWENKKTNFGRVTFYSLPYDHLYFYRKNRRLKPGSMVKSQLLV